MSGQLHVMCRCVCCCIVHVAIDVSMNITVLHEVRSQWRRLCAFVLVAEVECQCVSCEVGYAGMKMYEDVIAEHSTGQCQVVWRWIPMTLLGRHGDLVYVHTLTRTRIRVRMYLCVNRH